MGFGGRQLPGANLMFWECWNGLFGVTLRPAPYPSRPQLQQPAPFAPPPPPSAPAGEKRKRNIVKILIPGMAKHASSSLPRVLVRAVRVVPGGREDPHVSHSGFTAYFATFRLAFLLDHIDEVAHDLSWMDPELADLREARAYGEPGIDEYIDDIVDNARFTMGEPRDEDIDPSLHTGDGDDSDKSAGDDDVERDAIAAEVAALLPSAGLPKKIPTSREAAAASDRDNDSGYITCPLYPWDTKGIIGRMTWFPATAPVDQRSIVMQCYIHGSECRTQSSRKKRGVSDLQHLG